MLRYAEPLLAERAFIAQQAQAVEVRRSGGGASLRQAAAAAVGVPTDSDAIEWDAHRREDGKWVVSATYSERNKARKAEWTYDHSGRNIHPLDDDARNLMGVRSIADDRDAIADALDLVTEPAPEPEPGETRPHLVAVPDARDESPAEEPEDEESDEKAPEPVSIAPAAEEPPAPKPKATKAAPAKPAAVKPKPARKGRAHVPSWDEILFGATRPDDKS